MKILLTLAVLTAFVAVFVIWVMPWLKKQPWVMQRFGWLEPVAIALFKKSEQVFFARWLQFIGWVQIAAGFLGEIDYSPIAPFLPEHLQALLPLIPFVCNALGHLIVALRKDTTLPLEVVAAPAAVKAASPEVAKVEQAKVEAVVAVKEAEAQQAVGA